MNRRGHFISRRALSIALGVLCAASLLPGPTTRADETAMLGEMAFVNHGLVGVGRIPSDLRDKFGETVGSGSGLAADPNTWRRTANSYEGVFFLLPDRGYNVQGTVDYRARLNRLAITFKPVADGNTVPAEARQTSVMATLTDTILLTDAAGATLTGLDPVAVRAAANGFPNLPLAATGHVSIDSEALARLPDGSYFVGDEYGPYIYRFSAEGRMLAAIRPPEAFIPKRKGKDDFSSDNPGPGAPEPKPRNPETGRQNNQGMEGLTLTPGGRFLVGALQSATRQDAGAGGDRREYTRMLYYDVADPDHPRLVREHVLQLPVFQTADGKRRVAAQSEMLALDETHFLLLCRDGGNGYGTAGATSLFRRVEIVDTARATNIAGSRYDGLTPVAPDGVLEPDVVPATLTPFIDLNDKTQLAKFGLHNGEPNDRNNLSEKWEGMTLVPALDPDHPRDFFLFISNDNDFITQRGYQVGADYKDASGAEVDTMIMVYRLTLPDPVH
jgi:hypothetical protein